MGHSPQIPEDRDPLVALRMLHAGVGWAKLARSRRLWSGETTTFTISSIDSGASTWRVDGADYYTATNGLRFKRPGTHFRTVSVEEPSGMTILRLDAACLAVFGPVEVSRAFTMAQRESPSLLEQFRQLGCAESAEESLVQLLVKLASVSDLPEHAEGRSGRRADVARVRAILDRNASRDIRLAELASAAALHPVTLVRLFRQEYGLPPHAYQIERRVEAAQSLLAAGLRPCEVALTVGFCDQSHLHRHFKRRTGLTLAAFCQQERSVSAQRLP